MAITPGLIKGPANNWAPVTKSLLHALVPMASPFLIPGPESLCQCFAWDVVCSSHRWEMFLKPQPCFQFHDWRSPFIWLSQIPDAPRLPMACSRCSCVEIICDKTPWSLEVWLPTWADHSFRHSVPSARLNLLTWPWLRAPPHVSPALQFIPGCLVLSGAARSQSLIWADPDNSVISVLSA